MVRGHVGRVRRLGHRDAGRRGARAAPHQVQAARPRVIRAEVAAPVGSGRAHERPRSAASRRLRRDLVPLLRPAARRAPGPGDLSARARPADLHLVVRLVAARARAPGRTRSSATRSTPRTGSTSPGRRRSRARARLHPADASSFGPVVAYNARCDAVPALAALTAYLLCRHLTGSLWASLVGGYLFGFSSYMLGQELGHLHMTAVFLLPLVALAVVRFVREEIDGRGARVAARRAARAAVLALDRAPLHRCRSRSASRSCSPSGSSRRRGGACGRSCARCSQVSRSPRSSRGAARRTTRRGLRRRIDQRPAPLRRRPARIRPADALHRDRRRDVRAHLAATSAATTPSAARYLGLPTLADRRLVRRSAAALRAAARFLLAALGARGASPRSGRGSWSRATSWRRAPLAPRRGCRSSTTSCRCASPSSPRSLAAVIVALWTASRRDWARSVLPALAVAALVPAVWRRRLPDGAGALGLLHRRTSTGSASRGTRTSRSSRSGSGVTRCSGRPRAASGSGWRRATSARSRRRRTSPTRP